MRLRRAGDYVALSDLRPEDGWPSRATVFAAVHWRRIRTYKLPNDRKTYVRRAELERALSTPTSKQQGTRPTKAR